MSKVVLIDGNSLAYRAFYALPDTMRTTSGIVTNAVYGFTTMLLKVLEEKPDFVAISFDLPEPTFRHREYKEYKATREKAPPTLAEQLPYVRTVAEALDIPIYEAAGYEADDVIGTLAKKAETQGYLVTILTGDLDPLQLVDEKIKVLTTRKGITDTVLYGKKEVEERYGLKPEQLIDFKALKGDPSDNIPGVPKVGERTAVELLKEFETLENIIRQAKSIKREGLRKNITENINLAKLSKRLATIVTEVPLEIDFEKMRRKEIDWKKVLSFFEEMEFESLVKKYGKEIEEYKRESIVERKREKISQFNYQLIDTEDKLRNLIEDFQGSQEFAVDLETTSYDPFAAEMVGVSLSKKTGEAYYIPLGHIWEPASETRGSSKRNRDFQSQVPLQIIEKFKDIFTSDKLKIGHNLKYDLEVLKNHGFDLAPPYFDTMIAGYLLDPVGGKYNLKAMGKQYLGRRMIKLDELIGKETEFENFSEVPLDLAKEYACSDADVTFGLYQIFKEQLEKEGLGRLFYEVEMPLLAVLVEMEENGVYLDIPKLKEMSKSIKVELKDLERHIFAIAGEVFNINSPKQLAKILFTKLMLPVIKRTKTGPSTDVEVLEELAAQKIEIAEKLMEYRQLTKLQNTYIDVLPQLVKEKTGRVHTSFRQWGTATGRLSSAEPNLQNIPAQGKLAKSIRSAFIPEKEDWLILDADYSQIELRILAHLSNDSALIKAFQEGKDIHQATADELGISREAAKMVNFGIIYGISDFGLAKGLNIKKSEAAKFMGKYFEEHNGVKEFIQNTIDEAKKNGYVTTLLGRKRPMPDINSPHFGMRSFAERTAINTPVQGTAADMIKMAMIKIVQRLRDNSPQLIVGNHGKKQRFKSKLLLQVHDELVFECPKEEVDSVRKIVEEEMTGALSLKVPVKVDIGVGKNWAEAKP